MARGISIGANTADEARELFLAEAPDRTVIACEPIDLSDIPLRQPLDKPEWAVVFEDPDPSQFIQDADPVAKATQQARDLWMTMATDHEQLSIGTREGDFTCPACGKQVMLELPPDRVLRRPGFGPFIYSRCPECDARLLRHKNGPRDSWQVDTRPPRPVSTSEPEPPGKGLGPRRACIFCGAEGGKISKEHLWSKWMRDHVEASSGGTSSRIRSTGGIKVASRNDWPSAGFDREISGPCKRCNESWMEALEDEARPLLIPMLQNQEVKLHPEEQRILARWATLKMLIAQEGHGNVKRVIPPNRYRLFYVDRKLPVGAQIWIGRYNGGGSWPTNYQYRELFITMHGQEEPSMPNAYLVGFTIGYVAFIYWGHEMSRGPVANTKQVESYLTQIWPATGVAAWPPPALMEADGLSLVLDRFLQGRWI